MKTIQEIKDEYAKSKGCNDWNDYVKTNLFVVPDSAITDLMIAYAKQFIDKK